MSVRFQPYPLDFGESARARKRERERGLEDERNSYCRITPRPGQKTAKPLDPARVSMDTGPQELNTTRAALEALKTS